MTLPDDPQRRRRRVASRLVERAARCEAASLRQGPDPGHGPFDRDEPMRRAVAQLDLGVASPILDEGASNRVRTGAISATRPA